MPVIFISRGTMAGVRLLLECLNERTGIRCVSREDLEQIANRHGEIATRTIEKLGKPSSTYIQFSELRWTYVAIMRNALLEEIRTDNVVYHGYSGHLLVPQVHHFVRVRIEAPLDLRVKMTIERLKYDEQKAREYIAEVDNSRIKWSRFMYAEDIRNPMLYGINLNLGQITLKAACSVLESIISAEDFQASAESQAEVEQLYLASLVEAALVTDPRTSDYEIGAEVHDADVHLTGPYLEDAKLATVQEIAAKIPGVKNVQYRPGYAEHSSTPTVN